MLATSKFNQSKYGNMLKSKINQGFKKHGNDFGKIAGKKY